MSEGLDSMYRASLKRTFNPIFGDENIALLRRVMVTVLLCEEPVTLDGVFGQ